MLDTIKNQQFSRWIPVALLVLPWLNPYAAGPSPDAWPLLISAFCGFILWALKRRLRIEIIASAWMLAATVSAVMGLLQYFLLADGLTPWLSQPSPGTAFANLRQRNQFATLTSIGLAALIGWLALQPPGDRAPWWPKYIALILALGNAVSSSRTGFLQWVLILALTAWWMFPNRRRLAVFAFQAMLTYLIASVLMPQLLEFLTGIDTGGLMGRLADAPSCESRTALWSNVVTLIGQKPWFGWGWGELKYAHFVTLFPGVRFCGMLGNAHNLPLHMAVTLGIPLTLLVCGGFSWWVIRQRPWGETEPARQLAWGVLAVILLHSLVEYPLWYGHFQIAFGLCIWILWSSNPRGIFQKFELNRFSALKFQAPLAITLIAFWFYSAWDYQRVSQLYMAPQARDAAYRDDTLEKVGNSWLFSDHVRFAELGSNSLTANNAQVNYDLATKLLHFSPEPRVIEKAITSALLLGKTESALENLIRYRSAFPASFARWSKANQQLLSGLPAVNVDSDVQMPP